MRTTQIPNTHVHAGSVNAETVAPKQPEIPKDIYIDILDFCEVGVGSFIEDVQYLYVSLLEAQVETGKSFISDEYQYALVGRMFHLFDTLNKLNSLHILYKAEKGEVHHG